jgi:hypothetical protein
MHANGNAWIVIIFWCVMGAWLLIRIARSARRHK